uniref:DUF2254 domain-containing protein n=1 Tax=Geobacter sp. (strain M21) TaxID=443144 RepID=C6E1C0_GEOSM
MAIRMTLRSRLSALWDNLRTSFWFVPTLMAVGAFLAWIALQGADARLRLSESDGAGLIYSGGPDGAWELLSVVAASMITVTGVTFSITIVALVLASQQFGPFLLRDFMRDTGNQVVLGTFIATFLFCLLTLGIIRGSGGSAYVPRLCVSTAMLLTIASLGVLIFFIHHVANFIQTHNILWVVSADLQQAVDCLFPEPIGRCAGASLDRTLPETVESEAGTVLSKGYGYIKVIDEEILMKTAVEHDLVVRLEVRPGAFIGEGDGIASVWPKASLNAEVEKATNDSVVLASNPTAAQDVEFIMNQMVEMAVRALSPGINDPFTAMNSIDLLGQGLRRVAGREIPSPVRLARDGRPRVITVGATFPELLDCAFDQIRHYGRSSVPVLRRIAATLGSIASHVVREEDRQALTRHVHLLREAGCEGVPEPAGRAEVEKACSAALEALTITRAIGGAHDA